MNSKERVRNALARKPVDRVPVFMWFHPQTSKRLARLLEIPEQHVSHAMGDDVRQTWVNNNYAMEGIVHEHENERHTDFWNITWVKKGDFNQIEGYPLKDVAVESIKQYRFPFEHIDSLMRLMEPVVKFERDYFIGCDVSPCFIEMYCRIRGMENAIFDFVENPELIEFMLKRCGDFSMALAKAAISLYHLDWLWTGDDVGSQNGMMVSPDIWRKMIKPHLQNILAVAKEAGLFVAFHSCGSIRPIIPDLIEIGLDVLNPIQCNCPGMDPFDLKKEFGKELCFMGGVDTQDMLPHSTPQEVYAATSKLIELMTSDGGGYILAASHTVPPETPDENIFSMYHAAGISKQEIFDKAADIRKHCFF
jgi:uroporphyrinogen decarboxylase